MNFPNESERKEGPFAPPQISPEDQAEIAEIKLEQALTRYRLMLQRGMAWAVFPKKPKKAHIR